HRADDAAPQPGAPTGGKWQGAHSRKFQQRTGAGPAVCLLRRAGGRLGGCRMNHLLTCDLEDWNMLAYRRATGEFPRLSAGAMERQVECLLALLEEHNTQAT